MSFNTGWSNGGAWGIQGISASYDVNLKDPDYDIQFNNILTWSRDNLPAMEHHISLQKTQAYYRNNNGYLEGNQAGNVTDGNWWSQDTYPSTLHYFTESVTLDGTGVDIIIVDVGSPQGTAAETHGELLKPDGTGKLNTVNWNELLSLSTTDTGYDPNQPHTFYLRTRHARTAAFSAVGNTMGSAPGAELYSIKCASSTLTPDFSASSASGPGLGLAMNMAKLFHESKQQPKQ